MPITINGSTGIAGVDGSASTPAIQGTDTNTGVTFPAADTVAVSTGGSERMRVDSSGNVGIGTSSPSKKFVVSNSGSAGVELDPFTRSATTGASLLAYNRSTASYARMDYDASEQLFFISGSERARITSGGDLFVGSTSSPPAGKIVATTSSASGNFVSNNTASSGTRYHCVFYENGTERGSITSNGSSTSYVTTSDYRLKENVQPMQNALAKVALLNPVTYTWKADGSDGQGFIAHELQAVVPDCVTGEKDAVDADGNPRYQGVDTSFLVATLTKAIQELNAKVEGLQAEINALKGAA